MTDHRHRDDQSLVQRGADDETETIAITRTVVSNADAAARAKMQRPPEEAVIAPRERMFRGDGEAPERRAAGAVTDDDEANLAGSWAALNGPPAPRTRQFLDDDGALWLRRS